MTLKAYLQSEVAGRTQYEEVPIQQANNTPRCRSQTGYGNRIACPYFLKVKGRWRRVYAVCYSNCATHYIGPVKNKTIVRIDKE